MGKVISIKKYRKKKEKEEKKKDRQELREAFSSLGMGADYMKDKKWKQWGK